MRTAEKLRNGEKYFENYKKHIGLFIYRHGRGYSYKVTPPNGGRPKCLWCRGVYLNTLDEAINHFSDYVDKNGRFFIKKPRRVKSPLILKKKISNKIYRIFTIKNIP